MCCIQNRVLAQSCPLLLNWIALVNNYLFIVRCILKKSPSYASKRSVSIFLKELLCGILVLYCSYLRLFFTSRDWLKHNARQTERHRCFFFHVWVFRAPRGSRWVYEVVVFCICGIFLLWKCFPRQLLDYDFLHFTWRRNAHTSALDRLWNPVSQLSIDALRRI